MNIAVRLYNGRYIVRPDTTRAHEGDDFYSPEEISSYSYAPVLYARICKAGRSIGRQFASRYFEGINFGLFIYPDDLMDGSEESLACASCLDHTSFLPLTVYNNVTLGQEGNEFVLLKDGAELFRTDSGTPAMLEDAVSGASRYVYLRVGDLIAVELSPRAPLCSSEDGGCSIRATWCDNEILDFKIVM